MIADTMTALTVYFAAMTLVAIFAVELWWH